MLWYTNKPANPMAVGRLIAHAVADFCYNTVHDIGILRVDDHRFAIAIKRTKNVKVA